MCRGDCWLHRGGEQQVGGTCVLCWGPTGRKERGGGASPDLRPWGRRSGQPKSAAQRPHAAHTCRAHPLLPQAGLLLPERPDLNPKPQRSPIQGAHMGSGVPRVSSRPITGPVGNGGSTAGCTQQASEWILRDQGQLQQGRLHVPGNRQNRVCLLTTRPCNKPPSPAPAWLRMASGHPPLPGSLGFL